MSALRSKVMATIRQRRPGVWEVRGCTGKDVDGKSTQVSRTVYGTKKDAKLVAAVFVDHQCQLHPPGLQLAQVHDTSDSIEAATVCNWYATVTRQSEPCERFGARPLRIDDEHVASRNQDLVEGALGDLERSVDDLALLGRECGLDRDHVPQFLLGHLVALHIRVSAHHPHGNVSRTQQHPDDWSGQLRQHGQWSGHHEAPPLRVLHRDSLRGELAEHEGQIGKLKRHENHRCWARCAARTPSGSSIGSDSETAAAVDARNPARVMPIWIVARN
jgi:hypothetical protein